MGYTIPFYAYTTSRFGETAGRTNPHRGHDVAPGGQDFPAWVDGRVVQVYRHLCLGNVVVIQNSADGYFVGVSHLANFKVQVGTEVRRQTSFQSGTPLGNIGATGECQRGRHAHITVSPSSSRPESGPVIDPVAYANSAVPGSGPAGVNYAFGLSNGAQLSLQRAMSHVGRYSGPHDGLFGSASVKGMQQWLKDMGYLPGSYLVDGIPGKSYGTALQELARDKGGYGGAVDGVPGAKTSEALVYWAEEVVIKNGGGTSEDFAYGLTMNAQRACQNALRELKLYDGLVDGVFGPASVAGMQQYLKNVGILSSTYGVDGQPGPLYGQGLQELAAKHGYEGAIDGVPGEQTSLALERWAATITTATPVPTPPPVEEARKWPLHGTFGIDVASPQRDIDFEKAKADGAEFAIIKMGGLNVLPQYVAPYYVNQVDRALAAGLLIGHYYLIGLGQTPEEQARFFVANLHGFDVRRHILAIDNEKLDSNGTKWTDGPVARFIREVHRLTGIPYSRIWHYAGAHDYRTLQPWPELAELDAKFWWAAYDDNDEYREHEPDLQGSIPRFDVHQFSSTVSIAGYRLDGNWSPHEIDVLFAEGVVEEPDVEPDPDPTPEPAGDRLPVFLGELAALVSKYD